MHSEPSGWFRPDESRMQPGDWCLYCDHCGWQGETNTAYAKLAHECPKAQAGHERIWRKVIAVLD